MSSRETIQFPPAIPPVRLSGLAVVVEPVLGDQGEVVPLVEDLAPDVRVLLPEPANLAVLLGHELLVQRGDLDVEVVRGQVEVRRERLRGIAIAVPLEREGARLVLPRDRIEVEELRELPLRVVREADGLVRKLLRVDDAAPQRAIVFAGCEATDWPSALSGA
jgi:hypothetical protein